jgi:D-glycero-alpha-D-manno-heptose-7-phosphate kinase
MKKKIDYKKFGLALTEHWKNKRKLSKNVSNDLIDNIIDSVIKFRAYGGKLLGAGGGGFILLLTPENKKKFLLKKFSKFLNVPFKIDNTGSQIIYFSSQK